MKREKKTVNNIEGVNQNILNIITPSGLEFKKTSFMIGENYAKSLTITTYPTNPEYGWLSKISNLEGTTASFEFQPTDSGELVERCNEQIKALRIDLNTGNLDESVYQSKTKAMNDIKKMIERIVIDKEVVGYLNIILVVQAISEEKLIERVKKVQAIIATIGAGTRVLVSMQKEAYLAASPYGIPVECLKDMGERNMPLSTFLGGFLNASSGINDGEGYRIGTSEGKQVILNTRKRGDDRINSNWFVTGEPGSGKSTAIKLISGYEFGLGAKLIFLDPEGEYRDYVKNLGGKVINCGGGKGGRINPLQIRPVPKKEDDEEDDDDDLYEDSESALALHIQTLRIFHRQYKPGISTDEMDKLEEILENTYKRFNITWDTDISKLSAKEFPIYSDLYEDIEVAYKTDPSDPILKKLKSGFRSIAHGADSKIFNGYTDIDGNTDIIDLDISSLLEGDDNIYKAQLHNINSWVWQLATNNRDEMVLYVLDEGYLIVDPERPEAFKFVKNFGKRIRKYNGGLMFITHSVVDVLDPAVKRHGQALIDTACYKLLMGTDGKNLEETKNLFKLTDAEESLLLSKQRGKGILYAGSKRIEIKVDVPEELLTMMGKAGGR